MKARAPFFFVLLLMITAISGVAYSQGQWERLTQKTVLLIPPPWAEHPTAIYKPLGPNGEAEITLTDAVPGTLFTLLKPNGEGVDAKPLRPLTAIVAEDSEARCFESPRTNAKERLQKLNEADLRELVEIRSKKKELLTGRVRAQLSGVRLEQLRSYEQRFGLRTHPPLSPELPDEELVWRLLSIRAMLLNEM